MLTKTQRTTLAAHIKANADQAVIDALAIRNDTKIAELYNKNSGFYVWRERLEPNEYREVMVWTEIDGLQVGKARIWEWITQNMTIAIDATKDNVRAGLAEVFPANQETRGQLLAIAYELASLVESIYATGTGTESDQGVRVVVGTLPVLDVSKALNENS